MNALAIFHRALGAERIKMLATKTREYLLAAYEDYGVEEKPVDTSRANLRPLRSSGSTMTLQFLVSVDFFLFMDSSEKFGTHGGYRITDEGRQAARRILDMEEADKQRMEWEKQAKETARRKRG